MSKEKSCPKCSGTGRVASSAGWGLFKPQNNHVCPDCSGTGRIYY